MKSTSSDEDVYIIAVENGIGFYTESEFEAISEALINNASKKWKEDKLTDAEISEEKDKLISETIIHYIDKTTVDSKLNPLLALLDLKK
jgi:hypothetical protein